VTSYRVRPPGWPDALNVKAAVIADIHACEPLMSAARVRGIAELANRLEPDIIFLLGDFNAGHRFVTAPVYPEEWGEALSILATPLGDSRQSRLVAWPAARHAQRWRRERPQGLAPCQD